jgi:hypothetical protein
MRLLPASALLLVAASLTAEHTGSAAARLGDLQTKLRQSHQANDWQSNLASAVELKQLLNDNPDSASWNSSSAWVSPQICRRGPQTLPRFLAEGNSLRYRME